MIAVVLAGGGSCRYKLQKKAKIFTGTYKNILQTKGGVK